MEEELWRKRKEAILRGCLQDLPAMPSKIVRVFISSTFSDMVQERNALIVQTYPKLKELCRRKGLEFQVVDMRWGVREESQDDHMTSSLCIQEIYKCQQVSVGPTFVAFLGQKYGFRPFPASIAANVFETIRSCLKMGNIDASILDTWFKEDENASQRVYCLQAISSILTNYINKSEPDLMRADQTRWWQVFTKLQQLLRDGATRAVANGKLDQQTVQQFFISVTEAEINSGFLEKPSKNRQLIIDRNIKDMEQHLSHPKAVKFTDLLPSGLQDREANLQLKDLKEKKIRTALQTCEDEALYYSVSWTNNGGINPSQHEEYLHQFCEDFYEKMSDLVEKCLHSNNKLGWHGNNELLIEVLQHSTMCKNRCDRFLGREDILQAIREYLTCGNDEVRPPMVLYGASGSGKTSIMAMASGIASQTEPQQVTILRFLGSSPLSSHIHSVLSSICEQITSCYPSLSHETTPDDFRHLVKHFHKLLKVATPTRPLTIFLDSLDQLSLSNNAHYLTWFPWKLPPNVRVIVSTLPKVHRIYRNLKMSLPDRKYFIKVEALGEALGIDIIQHWLKSAGRKLSAKQNSIVQEVLNQCSLPLYTKLVFEEVHKWPSYQLPEKAFLAPTIQGIINMLMHRTEVRHGKVLVSRSLAYITAAMNGLSEAELEDVLSLDDEVLDEVFTFWVPPIRRIPPLLWTRIREDLGHYLTEREANGVFVLGWYHRQFMEVASERYLKDDAQKKLIHSLLADYFLGTWSKGAKKPFRYGEFICQRMGLKSPEGQADRMVSPQPLYWTNKDDYTKVHYNVRKLRELPFHLYCSGRLEEMLKLSFSYKWIHARVKTFSLQEMLHNMSMARSKCRGSGIGLLMAALRMAGSALLVLPNALSPEILARMPRNKHEDGHLKQLIEQCERDSIKHCALLPAFQCFDPPVEAIISSLEGHTNQVNDLVFSGDSRWLYSASQDGTVALWDISSGERTHLIDFTHYPINKYLELHITSHGLVCEMYTEGSPLLVIDPIEGTIKAEIGSKPAGYLHNTVVGKDLVVREGTVINLSNFKTIRTLPDITKQKIFTVVALTPSEKYLFVGLENATKMIDISTGDTVSQLKGMHIPCQIQVPGREHIVIIGYAISCLISIFDIEIGSSDFGSLLFTFDYNKFFPAVTFREGQINCREVSELVLSNNSDYVVANMRYCQAFVINLRDYDDITMLELLHDNASLMQVQFTADDQHVVGLCDNQLCIWNIKGKITATKLLIGSADSPRCIVASSTAPQVATVSSTDLAIKIWDVEKLEETGSKPLQKVYDNPLETMVASQQLSLAIVKVYQRLDTMTGYHNFDRFGLDVWDTKGFTRGVFLPYGCYGSLLEMCLAPSGDYIALCTDHGIIYVVHIVSGECVFQAFETNVRNLHLSADAAFLTIEYKNAASKEEVKVINVKTGGVEHVMSDSEKAIVTLDNRYAVWVTDKKKLTIFSLQDGSQHQLQQLDSVITLHLIPCHHELIAICEGVTKQCKQVLVYNLWTKSTLTLESRTPGILVDVAKNGSLAVDEYLQVFDLGCGELVTKCTNISSGFVQKGARLVRLTDSGSHVVWGDDQPLHCINAYCISSGQLVATVSTHSPILSLSLVSGGYTVLAGCSDGHFLAFRLHQQEDLETDEMMSVSSYNSTSSSLEDKSSPHRWKVMRLPSVTASEVDALYHTQVGLQSNAPLPVCDKLCIKQMEENATQSRNITLSNPALFPKMKTETAQISSVSNGNDSIQLKASSVVTTKSNTCVLL